jgi:putative Holliday junction resolvase
MATSSILGLDIGEKRIGVAIASSQARLASPLPTLTHDEHIYRAIQALISEHTVDQIVAGLPRNTSNEDTDQTRYIRAFVDELMRQIPATKVEFQDEAASSKRAEEELLARKKPYEKGDIDARAATYILQDYLDQHPGASQ